MDKKFALPDLSYADDLALIISGLASGLTDKVTRVAEIVWGAFMCAGLHLNWGTSKTAVLFRWHGTGAIAAKRDLALRL